MANPNPGKNALTHGSYSDELNAADAPPLVPQVFDANPQLDERDRPAVLRYCAVLARLSRVYRWLNDPDRDPVFSDPDAGAVHGVHEQLSRWERQANELEAVLAISPREGAKLGLDLARGDSMVRRMQGGGG